MALRRFGSGIMYGVGPGANDTPVAFGALQDVTLDFSYANKKLYGQNIFPEAVGRGEGTLTAKAKFGRVSGNLFNSLFFGQTLAAGTTQLKVNEAGTVPGTPFQITVTNGATFVTDLGVIDATTGIPLKKVASGPTTGQYSVAAGGVYTFAAADTGKTVLISYTWTNAGAGFSLAINNTVQGLAPTFAIYLSSPDPGGAALAGQTGILYCCVSSKLSLPTKMGDFGITELDVDCQANAGGQVALLSTSE